VKQAAFEALGDLKHASATALLTGWLARLQRGDVPAAVQLDLLEAAAKHDSAEIKSALAARSEADTKAGPLAEYLTCLDGGDGKAGRKVFFDHEATRCTRCHTLDGKGGNAGPVLDGIGKRQKRDYLLEALIAPSAKIAEGFGSTTLDLHDGGMLVGFITKDQDGGLTIVDVTGKATDVLWTAIAKRTPNGTSAMPAMGGPLSKRQIRDLIAFLAERK